MAKFKNNKEENENSEKPVEKVISSPIPVVAKKIAAKDFCNTKVGLKYKSRVLHVLQHKYPNQNKTVVDWEAILIKDEII